MLDIVQKSLRHFSISICDIFQFFLDRKWTQRNTSITAYWVELFNQSQSLPATILKWKQTNPNNRTFSSSSNL